MYIPKHFEGSEAEGREVMKAHSWALLTTADDLVGLLRLQREFAILITQLQLSGGIADLGKGIEAQPRNILFLPP